MKHLLILIAVFCLSSSNVYAETAPKFSFGFSWGPLALCTSGTPNVVSNPTFTLQNVPNGTTRLFFKLIDEHVPKYKHGGGQVIYSGETVIQPGHFSYKSPCPPDGAHKYTWHAYAINAKNQVIGHTTSSKLYPEATVKPDSY